MAIDLTTPTPLADAVAHISAKTPVGSILRTNEWAQMPLGLRQRAQFSAGVESMRVLSNIQAKLLQSVSLARMQLGGGKEGAFMDRTKFVGDLHQIAMSEGLYPRNGGQGGLRDITSVPRLQMIYDIQVGQAQGFAGWKADMDPDMLDAYPAQELIRIADRKKKRIWQARWANAGGPHLPGNRMAALKTDPVWIGISRFECPWPAFDFNSGMGLRDISRAEAEKMGLLQPGERVTPNDEDFNAGLEASVRGMDPRTIESLKSLFGDQVQVLDNNTVTWRGNVIGDLFEKAVADKGYKAEISLGTATPRAIASTAELDLTGYELKMSADDIRHAMKAHGPGNETEADQTPVTKLDFEMVPEIWRNPDAVSVKGRSVQFSKALVGDVYVGEAIRSPKKPVLQVKTVWRKVK